ncbi:MAG: hypothetical protein RMK90_15225, partial [Acetobacteraceae bacterium]|nr:hypothetical protein [Acetobacteraceae bacterium]
GGRGGWILFGVVVGVGGPALRVARSEGVGFLVADRPGPVAAGLAPPEKALFRQAYNLFLMRGERTDRAATELPGRVELGGGMRLVPGPGGWQVALFGGRSGEDGFLLPCGTPLDASGVPSGEEA